MASGGSAVDASWVAQGIVSALSGHLSGLSLDQNFTSVGGGDIEGLFKNLLQLSEKLGASSEKDEVSKWIKFANEFLTNPEGRDGSLKYLNEHLSQRAVLLGGLTASEADVVVFSALHSFVSHLSDSEMQKVPHVIRWMDYIQNKEDFGGVFQTIVVKKPGFQPHKKASGDNKITEKKKVKEKEPVEKDTEVSVTVLNIQVGLIRKAWKHPSADSLLVEEIDLGDGNIRQVVSGLAKYYSPDDIVNRHVVLITNVKPGKLRDVASCGLGAKLGERVSFDGYEGKPEDVLNPKKKQLEKITPHLYTDDKGVATFKGVPFMTSAGPCTSSVLSAGIK